MTDPLVNALEPHLRPFVEALADVLRPSLRQVLTSDEFAVRVRDELWNMGVRVSTDQLKVAMGGVFDRARV